MDMDKLVHRNQQVFSIIRPSVNSFCPPSGKWNVSHLPHRLWGITTAVVNYVDGKIDVGAITERKPVCIFVWKGKYL